MIYTDYYGDYYYCQDYFEYLYRTFLMRTYQHNSYITKHPRLLPKLIPEPADGPTRPVHAFAPFEIWLVFSYSHPTFLANALRKVQNPY